MIRLIAAVDNHLGIARDGRQPWQLTIDQRYFAEQTKRFGANVLMGRKTYEVIGRALPERRNFVASHHLVKDNAVETVSDVSAFLHDWHEDIWIIGGASLYEQAISLADELYITEIKRDYNCDQFFPHFDRVFYRQGPKTEVKDNGTTYYFSIYQRDYTVRPETAILGI